MQVYPNQLNERTKLLNAGCEGRSCANNALAILKALIPTNQ
jgi:hypothetical protein